MIEIVVLSSLIVVVVFLTSITAALGSRTQRSGRKDYYSPARVAEEMHHPSLLGSAQGAGLGGYYGGRMPKRRKI
jgi:hypothetical protein